MLNILLHKLGIIAIDNLPKIEVNFAIDAFENRTFRDFLLDLQI